MKKTIKMPIIGMEKALWTLAITALLVLTGAMRASADSKSVPFVAMFSGAAQFTSATTVEFVGSGHSTQMGMILNLGSVVITGPPDANGCLPNTNTEYLTAASGDLLVIVMDDIACPIDGSGLRFEGSGTWQVMSGTGRFENVTGSGSVIGFGNFAEGIFGTTVTGEIEGIGR